MEKKSMSIREMGKMLGLCKTEAYYLANKHCFEIRVYLNKQRVMVDSFEEWYDSQFHYKKVNGDPPGKKYSHTISIPELAHLIGVPDGTAYGIVGRSTMEIQIINGVQRITKESFQKWLKTQNKYKLVDKEGLMKNGNNT